jgi:hypothetical protein
MSEEFYGGNFTNIPQHGGMVEIAGGARAQHAIFYNKSVHNPKKSQEHGRPVFDDHIYVRVAPPGERLNVVDRPATQQDKRIWPMQWAAFEQNKDQTPEGTPVDLMYPDKPAVAATLRANGVHTVEQCAELSANAIESIGMGAQGWVNYAQKYVAQASKGVAIGQFRKEMEAKDGEIRVLNQQLEMLKQEVASLRNQSQGVDMNALQALIQAASRNPQMPGGSNIAPQFDFQAAQIAGTHKSNDLKPRRKRIQP